MAGTLTQLPPKTIDGHQASGIGSPDHPMRVMTRRAAGLEAPPWDADAAAEVGGFFDTLAPEWHTRSGPERTAVVVDALERGDLPSSGTAIEIGSGIGACSGLIADRFDRTYSCDLSSEMLRRAPAEMSARIRLDASRLPFGDGVASAIVLVNMFLFADEMARVLAPDGVIVWVNSSGESTPIHLLPAEVVEALPGDWTGVEAHAGAGLWCVVRRA